MGTTQEIVQQGFNELYGALNELYLTADSIRNAMIEYLEATGLELDVQQVADQAMRDLGVFDHLMGTHQAESVQEAITSAAVADRATFRRELP